MTRSEHSNRFRPQVEAFEDRLALSTLNFNAGHLIYTAGANVTNNLTISRVSNVNGIVFYCFHDTAEAITVTGDNGITSGGASGSGTTNIFIPESAVAGSISVFLGNGNDTIRLNSTRRPFSVGMGEGNDRFLVGGGVMSGSVAVNGQGGRDWLDYSLWQTGVTATVNGSGTRVGISSGMENIRGGSADDSLIGDGGANMLVGLSGADQLSGLGGRDILIGGIGADVLAGGSGEDLLAAGATVPALGLAQLEAIGTEWWRTDASYDDRRLHVRNGGGLNGGVLLNTTTVLNDTSVDILIGGADSDWFLLDVTAPIVDSMDQQVGVERRN